MKVRESFGLPGPDDRPYWEKVEYLAGQLGSDGCSGPTLAVYVEACREHDVHYRTGQTIYGRSLTRADADAIFRERHQEMSALGFLSPMAWWRWAALRLLGGPAWQGAS